jgi:hypothetical protein
MLITLEVHQRDRMQADVLEGTPMGALPTLGMVRVGPITLKGSAYALRLLSTALLEAADQADAFDRER